MHLFHPLDVGVAALLRGQRMFAGGWGDEQLIERLETQPLFDKTPAVLELEWKRERTIKGVSVRDGVFASPLTDLPPTVVRAHVRLLSRPGNKRVVIVLAGSREEGYKLRQAIYGKLVHRGIDVALLENPFYGLRRPPEQHGASVRTVSEHVLLNLAMIEEGRGLVRLFADRYERVCVAGYSMGGFMAGLVAASLDKPVAAAIFAAGASPSPTFTTQVLSWSVDYKALGGRREAVTRIQRIFDHANLTAFPAPVAPHAAIIVGSSFDAYVPHSETEALHAHWPGSELRWVSSGHISALFTARRALRKAVREALDRLEPSAAA